MLRDAATRVMLTMSNLWDCEFYLRCQNASKCLSCGPDQRLLSLKEEKGRKKVTAVQTQALATTAADDNSGGTLEEYVKLRLNDLPSVKQYYADRQAGSGNIWFMPGDVKDPVILAECKERLTFTTKGEKSITITKQMLEKIDEESKMLVKYPALPFRFKDDARGKTYVINDFDVLVDMVHEIKVLRHEDQVTKRERDMYKTVSEELHKEVERLTKLLSRK